MYGRTDEATKAIELMMIINLNIASRVSLFLIAFFMGLNIDIDF
jgi:hypothetical protein